jgi:hypothetical protein
MFAVTKLSDLSPGQVSVADSKRSEVDECVGKRIAACPYSFYFNRIRWRFEDGHLTLSGCVPTFYLKQVLQTLLRGIDDVESIHNDVDVVSAKGLSSVRPK